jgi:hypothetical protein
LRQNKTLESFRLQGFEELPIERSDHFFLADDLELLFELLELFEPPFDPPDFFAAVAMLMVLERSSDSGAW